MVTSALVAALLYKLVDFAKFVRAKDRNAIVTQLVSWAGGVAVVLLGSGLVGSVEVAPGVSVAGLDIAGRVLAGLALGSTPSVLYDLKKALDGTDSAKTPPLVP